MSATRLSPSRRRGGHPRPRSTYSSHPNLAARRHLRSGTPGRRVPALRDSREDASTRHPPGSITARIRTCFSSIDFIDPLSGTTPTLELRYDLCCQAVCVSYPLASQSRSSWRRTSETLKSGIMPSILRRSSEPVRRCSAKVDRSGFTILPGITRRERRDGRMVRSRAEDGFDQPV